MISRDLPAVVRGPGFLSPTHLPGAWKTNSSQSPGESGPTIGLDSPSASLKNVCQGLEGKGLGGIKNQVPMSLSRGRHDEQDG